MSTASGSAPVGWVIPTLLILASSTSVMSTDLYAPTMPDLPGLLDTTPTMVKLTMSLNLAGFGLAQLIHGPLADRFGRRPVIIGGLGSFTLFSALCAMAGSIEMLIGARALQGMAACAQSVVVMVVIRDLWDDKGAVRMLAIYGMAISLTPALAPSVGGLIHVWIGWQANFWLLTIVAATVTLLIIRLLPETGTPNPGALKPMTLLRTYAGLLSNSKFTAHTVIGGATLGGLFGFITSAPFVMVDLEGVPIAYYGLYQASSVLFYALGNVVAAKRVDKVGPSGILKVGVAAQLIGGLMAMAMVFGEAHRPFAVVACMGTFVFGMAHVFTSNQVLGLNLAPGGTGTAAALLGSIGMGGAALGGFFVAITHDGSAWPLAWVLFLGGAVSVLAFAIARPPAGSEPSREAAG